MTRNPRVIVIGPDASARDEIQKMLALSGFGVVGEAGYGIEAVSLAKKTEPEAVVIAVEEPLSRSLQTVQAMVDLLPESPIIGHSTIRDSAAMRKAMVAGLKDYLPSPVKEEDLINSIHAALAHKERRRMRLSGEMDEPVAAGTVITVFGAKGGIGKTTIATNLATALVQKMKQSVVIVDLDTQFGDVAILMDIPVERSIADMAIPEEEITREIVEECLYTHNTGVTILPAPIRPTDWRNVHAGQIERTVQLLTQTHDYVILDTPGAFNDIVARALEMATMVVLVCTVDMASLKDTLLALDMLWSWNFPQDKIKLVVNATNEDSNVKTNEIGRMLGRDVFWAIPYDRHISAATQLGMPVVVARPQAKAAESLTAMAYALSGIRRQQQASGPRDTAKSGFLSRILGTITEDDRSKREVTI